jgi:predicted RNase H-like HicB family nuclease
VKLETIPYNLRPHEIEAYSKDEEFCRKVRELKEFSEVVKDISNAIQNIKEIITLTIMIHSQTQP